MKFGEFHGHEVWQISWNPVDFMVVESGRFHGHEIWQISWNLADFMVMKSGGFHEIQADFMDEIWWIS